MQIETTEMHTCGEPLRVITSGLPQIPGSTMLEKRRFFRENYDFIRTGLMFEPRGHADMYGAILTDPVTDDADAGVFFMHNEGYSTMCGHAVIALTRLLAESEMGERRGNDRVIKLDAPAGRITTTASYRDKKIQKTTFENVPSFVRIIIDIKLPGSGHQDSFLTANLEWLRDGWDEIKFVITDRHDFDTALAFIENNRLNPDYCLFSPVTDKLKPAVLAEWLKDTGLPLRLNLQLHKLIDIQ